MDLISKAKLQNTAAEKGFNLIYLEKDYFLTALLYLIKDIDGLYFKGGTALNKIIFSHTRLSEDLDFTCKANIRDVKKKIEEITKENPNLFTKLGADKENNKFTRLQIYYKSYFGENAYVNVDLNSHAKIYLKPEKKQVKHFYREIPDFSIAMLNHRELIAEKIRSLFQRNQPRDYFDAYQIISSGQKIDVKLVKQKLNEAGLNYDLGRIFKNAKKIYSNWEEETTTFTGKPVTYKTAITTIARHFKYKEKKKEAQKTAKAV
ncbi:MAG: nucleotidyl transferase AbiEii/AbiGii toxin family protein [archaeon]|nr:nucleotidyl transferase AbiEii/AbiGii toxin family protein [archaeon]